MAEKRNVCGRMANALGFTLEWCDEMEGGSRESRVEQSSRKWEAHDPYQQIVCKHFPPLAMETQWRGCGPHLRSLTEDCGAPAVWRTRTTQPSDVDGVAHKAQALCAAESHSCLKHGYPSPWQQRNAAKVAQPPSLAIVRDPTVYFSCTRRPHCQSCIPDPRAVACRIVRRLLAWVIRGHAGPWWDVFSGQRVPSNAISARILESEGLREK